MSSNPYQSPVEHGDPDRAIRPERGRGMAVASLALLIAGTLASGVVVVAMTRAFGILGMTGKADPSELAAAISGVMWISLVGMLFTQAGGILAAISLFGEGNRERWFFALGMFTFVLQLGTLPLGTPIGLVLLFGGFLRWREFHPSPVSASPDQ